MTNSDADPLSSRGAAANTPTAAGRSTSPRLPAWLAAYPWMTFVLPLAVFMLAGSLEPTSEDGFHRFGLSIPYSAYPLVYALKIALTMAAMAVVWPGYRQFAWRVSPLAFLVGGVGVVLWVGLCKLGLESKLLAPIGLGWIVDSGARSAFNPLENWPDQGVWAYGFLALRFWGLAIIVPVIEEFFLRGFVMRFVIEPDWWKVPFGTLTPLAVAVGTLLPVTTHLGEMLAAAAWFTLVTWLMFKTRNIWDCVVAHAVTNLLLGVYVVLSGDWYFL
jgi:uncharacterized protein